MNTDMLTTAKPALAVAIFLLLPLTLSGATSQKSATFIARKSVAANHTALRPYSEIQCVAKCFEESRCNRCTIAGYNMNTHTCYLRLENLQDLSDVADQKSAFSS